MKLLSFFLSLLSPTFLMAQVSDQYIDHLLSQNISVTTRDNKIIEGRPVQGADGSMSIRTSLEGGYSEKLLNPDEIIALKTAEDEFFRRQKDTVSLSPRQLEKVFHARRHLFIFMDEPQAARYLSLIPETTDNAAPQRQHIKLLKMLERRFSESDFMPQIVERQTMIHYRLKSLEEVEECLKKLFAEKRQGSKTSSFPEWMYAQIAFEKKQDNALRITLRAIIESEPQARKWQDRLYMLGIHQLVLIKEMAQAEKLLSEMNRRDLAWDENYLPFPSAISNDDITTAL